MAQISREEVEGSWLMTRGYLGDIKELIAAFDYCFDRGCTLCPIFLNNAIKDLADRYFKSMGLVMYKYVGICADMIPREASLQSRIRRRETHDTRILRKRC